jgi:hypothetical protein
MFNLLVEDYSLQDLLYKRIIIGNLFFLEDIYSKKILNIRIYNKYNFSLSDCIDIFIIKIYHKYNYEASIFIFKNIYKTYINPYTIDLYKIHYKYNNIIYFHSNDKLNNCNLLDKIKSNNNLLNPILLNLILLKYIYYIRLYLKYYKSLDTLKNIKIFKIKKIYKLMNYKTIIFQFYSFYDKVINRFYK